MVDTGSPIRKDVFSNFKTFELHKVIRQILGFGEGKSITQGYFNPKVSVNEDDYDLNFYVVPSDAMKVKAIIGRDIIGRESGGVNVC